MSTSPISARPSEVASFLAALEAGFDGARERGRSVPSMVTDVFDAVRRHTGVARDDAATTPPPDLSVTTQFEPALARARAHGGHAAQVADSLGALASRLHWRRRNGSAAGGEAFHHGHANARILGQGGLEQRDDVAIGLMLTAPAIRYMDHRHPPEETYFVLSEGEWRREGRPWHRPGPEGVVHTPPDTVHAARAGPAPVLAVWCLWFDRRGGRR